MLDQASRTASLMRSIGNTDSRSWGWCCITLSPRDSHSAIITDWCIILGYWMLRRKWIGHLLALIQAYNPTRSVVMEYSPSYLMFERRPRIAIDVCFPMIRESQETSVKINSFVSGLKEALKHWLAGLGDWTNFHFLGKFFKHVNIFFSG